MKNLFIAITGFLLLSSCHRSNEDNSSSQENIDSEITKFIESNPDQAIKSLKFVILKDNKYYLDENYARKSGVDKRIIDKLKKDISDVNRSLDERKKYIDTNKKDIKEYEINLLDFQKMDSDSLIKVFHDNKNKKPFTISGDISTINQSKKVESLYNSKYKKVKFTAHGRTAIVSFHTFGALSSFGGWQYSDATGSMVTPVSREISLYTNMDNLSLSYSTSDPKGGICGYILN